MKTVRKVVAVLLFVAPMFVPVRSNAEGFLDFLHSLFRDEQQHRDNLDNRRDPWQRPGPRDPRAQASGGAGNSVPLDGGLVFLLAAGFGLGATMIYSRNRRVVEVEPA